MDPRPGLLVGPSVRLERPLGHGGMGTVWAAEHLGLQTRVAVKFLSPNLLRDPAARERFSSEAASAARIKSPHVVQVFDHGVLEDAPYIVMELLAGEDLSEVLERRGPLGLAETAEILRQAAKALAEVHAQGMVHRDIKPSNLFLTSAAGELLVKLLDFGIAKRLTGDDAVRTDTGTLVGTPAYTSPDQILEPQMVDVHRDLWALSVVAYECVTGRLPFSGPTIGAVYIAISRGVFTPPSEINQALPRQVNGWFARAFAARAADRFGSARELAESFAQLAAVPALELSTTARSQMDTPTGEVATTLAAPRGRGRGSRRVGVIAASATLGVAVAALAVALLAREPASEGTASGAGERAPPPTAAPAGDGPAAADRGPGDVPEAQIAPAGPLASAQEHEPEPEPAPAPTASASARRRAPPRSAQHPSTAPAPEPPSTPRRRDHGF